MNRELLKAKGEKVAECDFRNNGIYAGTETLYLYEGKLYKVIDYDNQLNYNGENTTIMVSANPKEELYSLFNGYEIHYESYRQLCERFGEDPEM